MSGFVRQWLPASKREAIKRAAKVEKKTRPGRDPMRARLALLRQRSIEFGLHREAPPVDGFFAAPELGVAS